MTAKLRFLADCLLCGLLVVSCKEEVRPEDEAAEAARGYHELLVQGDYEGYLSGMAGIDSVPDSYRRQLLDNVYMFMHRQQDEHNGIRSVRVASARFDSVTKRVDAFLIFCFGDSTNEEVMVPMQREGERWVMR